MVNTLVAQYGSANIKFCKNGPSLKKYLAGKLSLFTNDRISRNNFMVDEVSRGSRNESIADSQNVSRKISFANSDAASNIENGHHPLLKVIVLTIVCSDKF